jgi:hypothetical protein
MGKDDTASWPSRYDDLSEMQLLLTARARKVSRITASPFSTMRRIEIEPPEPDKRLRGTGRLQLKILLCEENNPDEPAIEAIFKHDLREVQTLFLL